MALSESNPALAGFYEAQQAPLKEMAGQLGNLTGILSLQQHLQQQREGETIRGILSSDLSFGQKLEKVAGTGATGITIATHLAALEKAKQDNEMFQRFTGSAGTAGTGGMTSPQLNDLGTLLAVRGHPGAATVMGIADKRDKAAADATALTSMRSSTAIPPDVQETQQAADQGTPAVATVPARPGVVPDYLLQDSIFGKSAAALKSRIDSGAVGTAAAAEKEVDRMNTAYTAWLQRQQAAGTAQAGREKLKAMAPGGEPEVKLTPGGLKVAEELAKAGRPLPGGWSRTGLSRGNTILNAMAANQEGGAGSGSIAAGQADYAANRSSLQQLVKRSDALEQSAKKIDKDIITLHNFLESGTAGGVKLTNTPVNKLREQFSDPKLGQLIIAAQIVGTEYERMINGGLLSIAQLHEGAREDAKRLINADMTPQEMRARLGVMVQEIGNQRRSFGEQIAEVKGRTSRSAGPANAPVPSGELTPQEQQELDSLRKRFGR